MTDNAQGAQVLRSSCKNEFRAIKQAWREKQLCCWWRGGGRQRRIFLYYIPLSCGSRSANAAWLGHACSFHSAFDLAWLWHCRISAAEVTANMCPTQAVTAASVIAIRSMAAKKSGVVFGTLGGWPMCGRLFKISNSSRQFFFRAKSVKAS